MQLFLILFSLFLLGGYILLLLYYRSGWKSIPTFNNTQLHSTTFSSIIIPARNEEKNIAALLDSLLLQDYPPELFEIILVNDHSTDNTVKVAASYAGKLNLRIISLEDELGGKVINSYKKKAIETGVAQSKSELIITTDADCIVPPHWLQTIISFYEGNKPAMMVMPVSINCGLKFIEIFQALDFMTLQEITGAAVHKQRHSMCNGANLAYTREAFIAVNGFRGIDSIASGDDMLLMHKIKERFPKGIKYLKSADVIVQTAPAKTIKDFFNQRIRWASKADKYQDKTILPVLMLVYILNVTLFTTLCISLLYILLFQNSSIPLLPYHISLFTFWLGLLIIKTIAELFFLFPAAKFFRKQSLLWLFPLMQPFHIIYTVIAGWLGKFGSYQWKERKVK